MSRARILADYVSSGDELADKAPLASPAFTGTPTGITKTHVGLSNVDNNSTSTIQSGTTAANVGLGNVTNESKATMLASPTLTGTATFSGDIVSSTALSHRNLIINGGMQVAQRGTSAVAGSNSYVNYLSVDRWSAYYSGTTLAQVSYLSNSQRKAVRCSATGSGEIYMFQKIENASGLLGAGEKFSVSAKIRASVAMNIKVHGRYYDSATQNNIVNAEMVFK